MPKELAERPTLHEVELPYWKAYHELHLSRGSNGFGPGPILLTEMFVYAELMEIPTGDERTQFIRVMRTMDEAYFQYQSKQHEHGSKN